MYKYKHRLSIQVLNLGETPHPPKKKNMDNDKKINGNAMKYSQRQ
jgi:hypothetical protein